MAPFKALLIEGTSGVGKSTLIDALLRRHVVNSGPRKLRSVIHLAQSHTYGPLATPEDRGTLTVAENLKHLDRILSLMEWLAISVQEHTKPWCFVIIDTLHLTQCVRPGAVGWSDVASIDDRLAALGCKLVSLRASSQRLWERGIEPRKNEQFLLKYAQKFGNTNEEIHAYFVREQEILADLFSRSVMPKLFLANDIAIDNILGEVYQFWLGDTGGPPHGGTATPEAGAFGRQP
ncbi:MAG: hypothetical protein WA741_05475 [Candidatus Sulfotelmatobacter sp.]